MAEYEIDTHYELNTGIYEFNSSLSCRYSFEQILDNEFDIGYPNIKVFGRVVDYFDIRTVADSGPQNITIEDENGYRITITVWDWEVANSKIADVLTKHGQLLETQSSYMAVRIFIPSIIILWQNMK